MGRSTWERNVKCQSVMKPVAPTAVMELLFVNKTNMVSTSILLWLALIRVLFFFYENRPRWKCINIRIWILVMVCNQE